MNSKYSKKKLKNIKKILAVIGVFFVVATLMVLGNQKKSHDSSTGDSSNSSVGRSIIENTSETKSDDTTTRAITSDITVTVSNASQDSSGGSLVVRTIVSSLETGTCKFELVGSSVNKSYVSKIEYMGTYFGCNIDIPASDLSNGSYTLNIGVESGTHHGLSSVKLNVSGL